jgi:SAM-dependent methyltransferase
MGRFESAVEFYARYREPYPREFFAEAARRLPLHGDERLLDVACGPAPLAIGFAPFVESCTGVDLEPGMIAAAREAARQAGIVIELIHSRFEDLPPILGTFQIVTIGRALHWLDPATAPAVFERLVAPGGSILSCAAIANEANPWSKIYHDFRRDWSSEPDERRYHVQQEQWFAPSRFRPVDEINVKYRHEITVDDLVRRTLSMSTTAPAVLGDRQPAFETALREAIDPFATNGILNEEVTSVATVFR